MVWIIYTEVNNDTSPLEQTSFTKNVNLLRHIITKNCEIVSQSEEKRDKRRIKDPIIRWAYFFSNLGNNIIHIVAKHIIFQVKMLNFTLNRSLVWRELRIPGRELSSKNLISHGSSCSLCAPSAVRTKYLFAASAFSRFLTVMQNVRLLLFPTRFKTRWEFSQ